MHLVDIQFAAIKISFDDKIYKLCVAFFPMQCLLSRGAVGAFFRNRLAHNHIINGMIFRQFHSDQSEYQQKK